MPSMQTVMMIPKNEPCPDRHSNRSAATRDVATMESGASSAMDTEGRVSVSASSSPVNPRDCPSPSRPSVECGSMRGSPPPPKKLGSPRHRALPMKKRKSLHLEPLLPRSADLSSAEPSNSNKAPKTSHGFGVPTSAQTPSTEAGAGKSTSRALSPNGRPDDDTLLALAAAAAAKSKANHGSAGAQREDKLTPRINDVLTGESPHIFDHIGNRRFRVLVEVNLGNYFSEVTLQDCQEQWANILSDDNKEPSDVQEKVVEMVVKSVEGNVPQGRFLIQIPQDSSGDVVPNRQPKGIDNSSAENEGSLYDGTSWRQATEQEVKAKVHSTFLAAGRFHVKQNAVLMQQAALQAHVEDEVERKLSEAVEAKAAAANAEANSKAAADARASSKAATAAAIAAEEEEVLRAEAEEMEVDRPTIPGTRSPSPASSQQSSEGSREGTNEDHPSEEEGKEGATELASANDAISSALSKYHAKNRKVAEKVAAKAAKALSAAGAAEEAANASQATAVEGERQNVMETKNSQLAALEEALRAVKNAEQIEAEYLAKTSSRLNSIMAMSKGTQGRGSADDNVMNGISKIVPAYVPSRSQSKNRPSAAANAVAPSPPAETALKAGLPSSIDELFAKNANGSSRGAIRPASVEEMYASSAATSPPSCGRASSEGSIASETDTSPLPGSASGMSADMARLAKGSHVPNQGAMSANPGAMLSADNHLDAASLLERPVSFQCPPRVKVFLALPMNRFFVEPGDVSPSSVAVPPAVSPAEYIIPSNYDILCGPGQAFFHHVGNRRFRITIEMNVQRYEKAYLALSNRNPNVAGAGTEEGVIEKLIDEMLSSLSKCDPPGRFLGMEMTTGRWRVLNPVYARLKTEQTFFECLQVKQKRQVRQIEEEWRARIEMEKLALIEELEGRMGGVMGNSGRMMAAQNNSVAAMARSTAGRRVSQSSMSGSMSEAASSCPTGLCPSATAIQRGLPSLNGSSCNEEELMSMQEQAKALLRRRQNAVLGLGVAEAQQAARYNQIGAALAEPSPEAALMARLQKTARGNGAFLQRRSSMPIMLSKQPSSLTCSFSSRGSDGGLGARMPKRGSNVSCDSAESASHPARSTGGGGSGGDRNGVKELVDVVGGMMMMSRRGSC